MAQSNSKRDPDKPAPISLNLDTLEREGDPGPFVLVLGGNRIMFSDAMELDWQLLVQAMQNPLTFFKLVLSADDQSAFLGTPLPTWKLRKVMDAYREHYGLVEPPE